MKQRSDPSLFGELIYRDVEPIDIGGTVDAVAMVRRVLPAVASVVIAREAGPMRLAGGLTVMADHAVDTTPRCDAVIACGGPGWPAAAADPVLRGYLRRLQPTGVASVCTGAMILAGADVLDGRRATTGRHPVGQEADAPLHLLGRNGAIRPQPAAVVAGVVTGGGVSLAIDATLYLLGRLYGTAAAVEVARVIGYDRAYAANRTVPPLIVEPPAWCKLNVRRLAKHTLHLLPTWMAPSFHP